MSMKDIIRINKLAHENHMSYGQYKDKHLPAGFHTQQKTAASLKRCPVCGDIIFGRGKYCSPQCCRIGNRRKHES